MNVQLECKVLFLQIRLKVCFTRSAVFGVPRVLTEEHLIGSQGTGLF